MDKPHNTQQNLEILLRSLKLSGFVAHYEDIARSALNQGLTHEQFLYNLCQIESQRRWDSKIERLHRQSKLPVEKTRATFDQQRLTVKLRQQFSSLCEGDFLNRSENILVFGLPGRGKTHLVCAIGHELIKKGHSIFFTPTYALVQKMLAAKRDLQLTQELSRLERYECVILDDIGYVQQNRDEMEVLFTFLAERYERRSVMLTSNLVFSQWDRIFKDPMTTAAAIDRVVHHSIILEMTGPSLRNEAAKKKNNGLIETPLEQTNKSTETQ